MYFLARLEETELSTVLRESGLAFFSSLSIHAVAMALVVGINIAISLTILMQPPRYNLSTLIKFFPLHWLGVALIFISGIGLLLAYPAKALSNPVFYLKVVALILGLCIARRFERTFNKQLSSHLSTNTKAESESDLPAPSQLLRPLAIASLAVWFITISAGRFLAYTNSILLASRLYWDSMW